MSDDPRLRQALQALSDAVRERLARHPLGHLLGAERSELELALAVPINVHGEIPAAAVAAARAALDEELDALLAHRDAFRPGRVYCLRCASAGCEHAAPPDARHVFTGYGPSGLPRFRDFAQHLLELQHPQLDRLYRKPPQLVTALASGRDLTAELLPAFRDRPPGSLPAYHLHGQVAAGWFQAPRADGTPASLALTFQVVSSQAPASRPARGRGAGRSRRRRLVLGVLGAGPDGEPLLELYDRLPAIPWKPVVEWGQSVLDSIERAQGRQSTTAEQLSRRVEGVLRGIARRLEQGWRASDRRTVHAAARHAAGDRPTRMALADLARAAPERFLADERHRTIVVLGERGRAHVWSPEGKLVTSIRYSPESIERKRAQEVWRPARRDEIRELRAAVEGEAGGEA